MSDASLAMQGFSDLAAKAAAAHDNNDLESALELWARCRALRPTDSLGYLQAGIALRTTMRFEEADAVLAEGLLHAADRFPIAVHHAWVAHHSKDWANALARWEAVAREFPSEQDGHSGIGLVFLQTQRLDEAESQLAFTWSKFPHSESAATLFAEAAIARADYQTAVLRLDAALAINPNAQNVHDMRGMALWQIGMQSGPGAVARSTHALENPSLRSLLMQFESLGENCELGLVQRHFHAEPLGLLRWTHTRLETLIRILDSNFSGLGEVGSVEIKRPDGGEYYVRDTHYGIVFHTFISHFKGDESELLSKQAARLRWLKEKILADLSAGEKTFVYKFHDSNCALESVNLFRALSRYGNCRLLCVSLADQTNAAGSVRTDGSGLFYGYLSRLNPTVAPQSQWDIPFAEWISICGQVSTIGAR